MIFSSAFSGEPTSATILEYKLAPVFAPRFFNPSLGNTSTMREDFPLPEPPASVEASGGFNYPNSNGFQFEASAIHKCIREGRTSSDQYAQKDMMAVRDLQKMVIKICVHNMVTC